ncbi:MAG: DUF6851 domain-containing protein [Hormoscilla sp.]
MDPIIEITNDDLGWINGVGISPVWVGVENGEPLGIFYINPDGTLTDATEEVTPSVLWDETAQQAVRNLAVGPTISSRAYGMMHTAIFDAWTAYDPEAIATQLGDDLQQPAQENTLENKTEAMSYAAYRVLEDLFPTEVDLFDSVMDQLGYDPADNSTDTTTPAGIGNVSAQALLDFRHQDGSNQLGDLNDGLPYSDYTGYEPVNPPQGEEILDPNRWQPLLEPLRDPNGTVQEFLGAHWGLVTPFALESGDQFRPPVPPEFGSEEYRRMHSEVVEIGANLTDEQKIIAEFWEDGPGTSFPPGSWMSFGQFVSERDDNTLDEDVQMFFLLGNAVMDAGIAAWDSKQFYDYIRPISAIEVLFGGQTIQGWGGPGQGTVELDGSQFIPYQRLEMPTPPFGEYVSGHSTFSAAAAEVLQRFTGSDEFGASVTAPAGESLFERGITPAEPVSLTWDTFTDAANSSGISRLYGGIHNAAGNEEGLILGRNVGEAVWEEAQFFISGGDVEPPPQSVNLIRGNPGDDMLMGTPDKDLIISFGGDDRINSMSGDDIIFAGPGADNLTGGMGNDELLGGRGNDFIQGGAGDDIINGGPGRDLLLGGPGSDIFVLSPLAAVMNRTQADVLVDFDSGADTIGLTDGLTASDLMLESLGTNTVIRLASDNRILGIVNRMTPDDLNGSFVPFDREVF